MNSNVEVLQSDVSIDFSTIMNDPKMAMDDILKEDDSKKLKLEKEENKKLEKLEKVAEKQPPPIIEDEQMMIRKRSTEIRNWLNHPRLGRHLKDYKNINLDGRSLAELDNLIQEIKYAVNSKNNSNNVENFFKYGTLTIENMANRFTNLDLTGYSAFVNKDDQILDTVAEVSMSYQDLSYVSPEKRLIFGLVSSAMLVNSINKNAKVMDSNKEMLNKPVSQSIISDYNDL